MIKELGWLLPHFSGQGTRSVALPTHDSDKAHLLNTLEKFERGEDVELDEDDLVTVKKEAAKLQEELKEKAKRRASVAEDDTNGLIDACDKLPLEDEEALEQEVAPFCAVLVKICGLAYKIIHSSTILLLAWKRHLCSLNLTPQLIPQDVKTRWNSTYDMLDFASNHRRAIKTFTQDADNNVCEFGMTMEEWELVEALMHILHILKLATLYFSSEDPTVADVILAIDKINQFFTSSALETVTRPKDVKVVDVSYVLKVSLMCAKRTLNKYYTLTDTSSVYRIAMILHPQYKLSYFRDLKWEPEWINEAHQITLEAYQNHYHN
ncbi:hypothetical protein PM082_004458 [Marasmius tenuissimus]|nr:hypothetical protein PM082_004458 [Marasmius tenuissimus]